MSGVVVVHGHRDAYPEITEECLKRVARAERLVQSERVKLLVFSGAGRNELWPSEARQMARAYRGPVVPFVLEECSRTTLENAAWTLQLLSTWGVDLSDIAVISSWWHWPRVWSCWSACCRRLGVPMVRVVPSRGSWRYVPGELVALWRSIRGKP